ncbi:MAG: glycoside hydrolase/phage tail family protein [Thalassovita sp.]
MATILLSAAGAALGGSVGGSVLGLSMVAAGRLVGASVGRVIDQRLLGGGSAAVETGRVDRFRLTAASEGEPVAQVFGRMRVGGQVIWASQFSEHQKTSRGGKGALPQPSTTEFSYSVSLAVALCEGEIGGVPRVWADGQELAPDGLNMRVYLGGRDQHPDPKIEAIEGQGRVPGYRGTAYVVFEDLDLAQFGNRVPQFSFEILRPDFEYDNTALQEPAHAIQAVALMPGTGEYALATQPAVMDQGMGVNRTINVNAPTGQTDLVTSLSLLNDELPNCKSTSLIVSWFGDDLRCGACSVRPKVEQTETDAQGMPWSVSGLTRTQAEQIPAIDDRPIYGGTPSDQSVIQAISALNTHGQSVMFYPFLLMDQQEGNTLTNPWTGQQGQPALPWRGRITGAFAPGVSGTPDQTATAEAEVAAFFGTVSAAHFDVQPGAVQYTGPEEWSYRRFILHNAALCAAAGGVEAFCIGSEMRALTQLRGETVRFPTVAALIDLAQEVRSLLGSETKLGYAADWSEYFGYHPQDGSGDVYFHLDDLWADSAIDFVGIDNYMPLSDWREGTDHADAPFESIYNPDYLRGNIEGGEGFDWYYHSQEAQDAQIRTDITDGAHQEPWVFRYKDIRSWWAHDHHNRIAGTRQEVPTAWQPQSKPIWFTELGCAAIDKGTNQPNKFLDPKSSESKLPKYSDGRRDEFIQMQYLRAMLGYWSEPAHNPQSVHYDGRMLDMRKAFVWAWDARPFPAFPQNQALWSDGENYTRGHWINGRGAARSLASVVTEICRQAGVTKIDTAQLYGLVRGYHVGDTNDARSALQPLMLTHGFDALERDGVLVFRNRTGGTDWQIGDDSLVVSEDLPQAKEHRRAGESEITGRVRLRFVEAGADYETAAEETVFSDEVTTGVSQSELPMALTRAEGRQIVERWMSEARVARDTLRLSLPPSQLFVGTGDVLALSEAGGTGTYRVDRVEYGAAQLIEAVRIEPSSYTASDIAEVPGTVAQFAEPAQVFPVFLDLPLITGDEQPHAPHLAVSATPWPGTVAVYSAPSDADYSLLGTSAARATLGVTETALPRSPVGLWDRQSLLQVKLSSGSLQSVQEADVLSGANLAAIGDGAPENWELIQFQMAELVDRDTYHLRGLLRGQLGSDALMPDHWPEGSYFVMLDQSVQQLELASSTRNISRHYRIGAARRGYDDPSYRHQQHAFSGVGLKPYAPAHLRAKVDDLGGLDVSWIRRTRINGDSWDGIDVPLGEESEQYLVRLLQGPQVMLERLVSTPSLTLSSADLAGIGGIEGATLWVAQVSALYGPGAARQLDL